MANVVLKERSDLGLKSPFFGFFCMVFVVLFDVVFAEYVLLLVWLMLDRFSAMCITIDSDCRLCL
jgi:hypothetical protein